MQGAGSLMEQEGGWRSRFVGWRMKDVERR